MLSLPPHAHPCQIIPIFREGNFCALEIWTLLSENNFCWRKCLMTDIFFLNCHLEAGLGFLLLVVNSIVILMLSLTKAKRKITVLIASEMVLCDMLVRYMICVWREWAKKLKLGVGFSLVALNLLSETFVSITALNRKALKLCWRLQLMFLGTAGSKMIINMQMGWLQSLNLIIF